MADRRRLTIWLSGAEWAGLDATAEAAGVETGALAKEALLRAYVALGRDVSAGRVKLRRRSSTSSVPVPGRGDRISSDPGPSSGTAESESLDPGVARAMAFRRALERR